jgi:C_GCAxxG_C_C family probable redox protein
MTTPSEIATDRFKENFNCAQSVFAAFAPQFGLPEEQALKLASPFGGGVARQGQVCGAVVGALLVLGLWRGASTPAGKAEIYRLGQEFIRRFEAKHASILCRQLIDCDLSTPEGYQLAKEKGVFTTVCPQLVSDAAEILQAFLEDRP